MGERSTDIEFCGERLTLTPERAAVWESTLLLADTHWGKTETHLASGVPLPDGDVEEQLARLDALLGRFDIECVTVVGDLLHAGRGITDELVARVAAWRMRVALPFTVVAGNHDTAIDRVADGWGIDVVDELDVGPFVLRHIPGGDGCGGPEIAGHIHPVVGVRGDGDRLRLPCFWVRGESRGGSLVLPAFSAFTGGERIRPGVGDAVYAVAGDRVVPIESGMLTR